MADTIDSYAVVGNPVAHSRSPQIHDMFARQTGATLRYERLRAPLDGFERTVRDFFEAGGKGLNVTVPFKQEAFALASGHLSARAREAGAVNTLWLQDGVLHGCNTDGIGLLRDLARLGVPVAGARILLVGAGGAARGAVGPLLGAGSECIRVVNRTAARAHELVALFGRGGDTARLAAGGLDAAADARGWDLVINATASGLADAAPDLPEGLYAPHGFAYDMLYAARPTPFMQDAAGQGARTADGLGMLVEQAAESFRIWRGVQPDTAPVLAAMRAALGGAPTVDAGLA